MIVFSVLIACVAHSTVCSLSHPRFSHFEAESKAMCEQNVRILTEMNGLQDFIVSCSDKEA